MRINKLTGPLPSSTSLQITGTSAFNLKLRAPKLKRINKKNNTVNSGENHPPLLHLAQQKYWYRFYEKHMLGKIRYIFTVLLTITLSDIVYVNFTYRNLPSKRLL